MSKGFYSAEEWKEVGWAKGVEAANHINAWIQAAGVKGLHSEIISNVEENLTPIIFVEVKGDIDETYFFYGHFDKQPPFVGWN
jgi:RNA binding exosome subunit